MQEEIKDSPRDVKDLTSKLKDFVVEKKLSFESIIVSIGKIHGEHAIYIVPYPTITKENIQNILSTGSFELTQDNHMRFSCNCTPQLIYPATERHIAKYVQRNEYATETYEEYLDKADYLQMGWMDNIIHRREQTDEKVYFENEKFVIIKDYKWDGKNMDELYLLLIFKDGKYRSIREIEDKSIMEEAKDCIYQVTDSLDIPRSHLCLYCHYRPSYFRVHIHILNISKNLKFLQMPLRNILVDDIIKNLTLDKEYYKRDMHIIRKKE
ncbi:m7GpppX diphosphatase [Enteropsectra breve]|nr:m7GpppX diphosphatase [Enteropsectra breve]